MTDSPYAANACPGPCNRRYRRAIDDHETAKVIHEQARATYEEETLPAFEDAHAWWQVRADAGVLVVREPTRPAPPTEPAEPTTAHNIQDPVWCGRCPGLIRAALANLDDLASLLDSWSDGHRGATSGQKLGKVGPKAHPGSPSRIADELDELYGRLVEIEDLWRDANDYPKRPQRARDARARRQVIAFLLEELRAILNNPGSVKFGLGILAWERRLQAMTTSEPVVARRNAVRCPRCRERALRSRNDGYTQCAQCGQLLSEDEYQELVSRDDGSVDRTEETISA